MFALPIATPQIVGLGWILGKASHISFWLLEPFEYYGSYWVCPRL